VLDAPYLLTAVRHVPVRAGLMTAPSHNPRSSAASHCRGQHYALVLVAPLIKPAPSQRGFLAR
jgi:hypothetical protein